MNGEHGKKADYVPPCRMVLGALGISLEELNGGGRATVSAKALRTLIRELVRRTEFDPEWYSRNNPDVEGARLAGDVTSPRQHFVEAGYFEGRLPRELPFDPRFYRRHYADIAESFPASDASGMREHFLHTGYFEGRAGTAAMLEDIAYWRRLLEDS